MWIFDFYRLYFSIACAIGIFFLYKNMWLCIGTAILVRTIWFIVEVITQRIFISKNFNTHIDEFKQLFGPYGIRVANRATQEWHVKKSLAEVFTNDKKSLKKTVENLEVMDTLFQAGMKPQGDDLLVHDLKLKYGKKRLEQFNDTL